MFLLLLYSGPACLRSDLFIFLISDSKNWVASFFIGRFLTTYFNFFNGHRVIQFYVSSRVMLGILVYYLFSTFKCIGIKFFINAPHVVENTRFEVVGCGLLYTSIRSKSPLFLFKYLPLLAILYLLSYPLLRKVCTVLHHDVAVNFCFVFSR